MADIAKGGNRAGKGKMSKMGKKKWYQMHRKKKSLHPDQRGFLLFCNHSEKKTLREGQILLNEYADLLYGPDTLATAQTDEDPHADEEEIDDLLERERSQLKLKMEGVKRFDVVDCGVPNVLFVKTSLPDPGRLAETILR